MGTEFTSRRDLWLSALLIAAAAAELFAAATLLFDAHGRPWLLRGGVAALLIAGAGVILWTLLDTRYVIADGLLVIRCGPFRWKFPVSDVRAITPVRSVAAAPALSSDRVALEIAGRRAMEISPRDRDRFTAALRAASGGVGPPA